MYDKYHGLSTRCPKCYCKLRETSPAAYPVYKPLTNIIRTVADARQTGFCGTSLFIHNAHLQRKDVLGVDQHGTVFLGMLCMTKLHELHFIAWATI